MAETNDTASINVRYPKSLINSIELQVAQTNQNKTDVI